MKKTLFWSAPCLIVLCLASACGGKPASAGAADVKLFDKASPEIRQNFQAALAADKTNNFVLAEMLLYPLLNQPLSAEQKDAVLKAIDGVKDHLGAALDKGDPAAKEALAELQAHPPLRQQ